MSQLDDRARRPSPARRRRGRSVRGRRDATRTRPCAPTRCRRWPGPTPGTAPRRRSGRARPSSGWHSCSGCSSSGVHTTSSSANGSSAVLDQRLHRIQRREDPALHVRHPGAGDVIAAPPAAGARRRCRRGTRCRGGRAASCAPCPDPVRRPTTAEPNVTVGRRSTANPSRVRRPATRSPTRSTPAALALPESIATHSPQLGEVVGDPRAYPRVDVALDVAVVGEA